VPPTGGRRNNGSSEEEEEKIFPKNIRKMLVQLFMKNVGSTFCLKNVASIIF
jgi:hypothetical protein